MKKLLSCLLVGLLLTSFSQVQAAEKEDEVLLALKNIVHTLVDVIVEHRGTQDLEKRNAAIAEVFYSHFDRIKMAKATLGAPYRSLDDKQKLRFAELYGEFVLVFYMGKFDDYGGEQLVSRETVDENLVFEKTELKNERTALAHTFVAVGDKKIAVNYAMSKSKAGQWQVYDVEVEGIRLSSTYQAQFQDLLNKEAFQGLEKELLNLIENNKKSNNAGEAKK